MLPYILALAVAVGSFAIYMAAFFFPEVHRKGDLIWSGVGLFYALVLWFCAGQISGAVLLGQMASVGLLGWFGWQALTLRRQTTPLAEQTPVSGEQIDRLTGGLTGMFKPKSPGKPQTIPQPVPQTAVKVEEPAVVPPPVATVPEVPQVPVTPEPVTPEPVTPVKPAAKVTTAKPKTPRFADRFSFLFKGKDKDKDKNKNKVKSPAKPTPGPKTQPQPPAEVASVPSPEPTLVQPPVPVEPPPAEPTLVQPPVPVEPPLPEPGLIQPEPEVIPVDVPGEMPTEDTPEEGLEMPAAAALEGATGESELSEDDDFGFDEDDLEGPGVTKAEAEAVAETLPNPPLDEPVKPSLNKVAAKSATPGAKKSQGPGLLTQIQEGLRGLLNFRKSPPVKPKAPISQPVETKTEVEPKPAIAVDSVTPVESSPEIPDTKPPEETPAVESVTTVESSPEVPDTKPAEETPAVESVTTVESSPEVPDTKPSEETATVVVTTDDVVVEVTVQEGEPVEVVTSANPSAEEAVEAVITTDEGIVAQEEQVVEATSPHSPETEAQDVIEESVSEVLPEGRLTPEPVEEYAPEVELAPPAESVVSTEDEVVEVIEVSEPLVEVTSADPDESELQETKSNPFLNRPQRQDSAVVEVTPESGEAQGQVTPPADTEPTSQKEGNS
ncbi:Ycf66 family protein [Oscillatoria sp. HE19RPO]|uniref:Ycf66 family protein n=1 Tax=Oscillatoria sp. HE19RPO TaxID=2954806 RepID=UPI0020C1DDFC|nr:Ycf66 family protein [Oscillatoria sp. HE19RPO]